jgi:hypothetical protein
MNPDAGIVIILCLEDVSGCPEGMGGPAVLMGD